MAKDKKIKHIYDKINKDEINHKFILDYIDKNNINYTKNNNGIFINISILNEEIINNLYNYIKNNLHIKIENKRNNILKNI